MSINRLILAIDDESMKGNYVPYNFMDFHRCLLIAFQLNDWITLTLTTPFRTISSILYIHLFE